MRKLFVIGTILLVVGFGSAQKRTIEPDKKPIKQVELTTRTLNAQTPGKQYTIDLTKAGTIYNIAADLDRSRVQIHTAKGDMTIAELLRKSGKTVDGSIRIGMTSDLRAQRLGTRTGPGRLNYTCGDLGCSCSGDEDCNDMFNSNACGPVAVCNLDGCICLRF